ncbi:bifunctional diguanylate cyclase/phosphodiesterase [Shewanella sp. UCD-KL12]|uniref:putative bifunctional diguanylate cyclase/phosphodiesterase n=1 Tax=Shewanella sp. UCD-KL12 TaxID=1917163 RepID=UPI0009706C89|nr:GGDEF domain-containing phosphodiesterase [Shewanella sp. UCD-KL12]
MGIVGLIAGLILLLFAGILLSYRHSQRQDAFIRLLISQLKKHIDRLTPSSVIDASQDAGFDKQIPKRYLAQYSYFAELLQTLPPRSDRDKLTGFANRLALKQWLADSDKTKGTLVLIDIYRLRFVNDLFGFSYGDQLLKLLSLRLAGLGDEASFLARMNEDEFLIYFDDEQSEDQLNALKQRLQSSFMIDDTPVSVQLQLGYVDVKQHYTDVSQLLRRLDLALIHAKGKKLHIAGYQTGDDEIQHRQLSIINHFPSALAQGELYLVYQPKLCISSKRFTQMEALIRWQHSELGTISPVEFIPLLEYAGMIGLLSQWAIEAVISQQAKWRERELVFQVAVNLSSQDILSETLCSDIQSKLEQYQLDASALSIEITESKLMEDMDLAIDMVDKLSEIGVSIAIDDFGTGHSSLAYLKQFTVDEVKIDKAFLDDLLTDKHAAHIMETCIALAKGLEFSVTVEGVETFDIYHKLVEMGVDKIQGDLFSKPLTANELQQSWTQLNKSQT